MPAEPGPITPLGWPDFPPSFPRVFLRPRKHLESKVKMVEAAGIAGQRSWPCASRAKLAREPASESLQMILKAPRRLKPRLKPSPDFPPIFQKTKGEFRPTRILFAGMAITEVAAQRFFVFS